MNMSMSIGKGRINRAQSTRSFPENETSRDFGLIEAFFSQFEKSIQETFKPLFEKDDPLKATFVCISCHESFPGAKIKNGCCPICSSEEVFPKDFEI